MPKRKPVRCDECHCFVSVATAYHDVGTDEDGPYAWLVTDCRNCGHAMIIRPLNAEDAGR